MIRNLVARFTLMTLVAAACGPSSQADTPTTADPTGALAAARERAQDLANSNQNYQPVRFVSEIERVNPPRVVRTSKPDVVVREGDEPVVAEPVPAPAIVARDAAPSAEPDSLIDTDPMPRVPTIIPREAPLPAAVGTVGGAGEWRGNDPGPDMGTVIGVVLRGGRGDPGHCPRHPRPPSQIPNRIPQ